MQYDLKYWLALSSIPDVGPYTIRKLLSVFKTPENIFKATEQDLFKVNGISENKAREISTFSDWDGISRTLDNLNRYYDS